MSRSALGAMVAVMLLGLLAALGCEHDLGTPQGVAGEFLDQHYVHISLEQSKDYTIGLARKKVDEEIRLTAGEKIDATTRKPKVYYDLIEQRENRGRLSFLYQLTIQPQDADPIKRRVMIRVRRHEDGWRVSNFLEY